MKNLISTPAKRALALALALVLVLSLVPALQLNTSAASYTDGAWYKSSSYDWINIEFETNATRTGNSFIFKDNNPYDWKVTVTPGKTPVSDTITSSTTIRNESGAVVSTSTKTVSISKGATTTMCSPSDFAGLTTSMFGTFTLLCEAKLGNSVYASYTQTFTRERTPAIATSVSSRSNPDLIFTHADPIDLVLNIKKSDGVSESFTVAVSVTNQSDNEVMNGQTKTKSSTNVSISVKDLMNISAITSPGTYKANVTLTNSSGNQVHTATFPFCVVALSNTVNASITSATNSDMSFGDGENIDLVVNLSKADNIREGFTGRFTITDANGRALVTKTMDIAAFTSTSVNIADVMDLSALPLAGSFQLNVVLTDDAGNVRCSKSAAFSRTSSASDSITLTNTSSAKTGNIYNQDDDFQLVLNIYKPSLAGQTLQVACTGTLNDAALNETLSVTLSSQGAAVVNIDSTTLLAKYGVYKDVAVKVSDSNGNALFAADTTYTFSRVLATADPGDMPLVNINDHFTSGKGDPTSKLALAAQTGANMWRASIPWTSVETSQGSYSMPGDVAKVMDATLNTGMQALIILAYGNDAIYDAPNPNNPTWLNAYANYCYYIADMMAQYYPNQVVGFEIWNEWNHATMSKVPEDYRTGDNYAKVVLAASAKIKEVNQKYGTSFKVIAGATAGDGYGETNSNTFIKAMLAASGFLDAIDGISFHTYSSKETTQSWNNPRRFEYISPAEHDFAARISNYKSLLSQYNAPSDLEVWLTETGWATNAVAENTNQTSDGKTHITTGVTEQLGAAYMVQMYTWAMAEEALDRIFWYDLMNDINDTSKVWQNNTTESNYGLIHNHKNTGDQPLAYSAKQGYVAMCALSSKLGGAYNAQSVNLGSGVQAYSFTDKDGTALIVAWTTGTAAKTIRCSGSMNVTDMYGTTTNNLTTATLSECPIYIVCNSGTLSVG